MEHATTSPTALETPLRKMMYEMHKLQRKMQKNFSRFVLSELPEFQ